MPLCPLCHSESTPVDSRYNDCTLCRARFLTPTLYLSADAEKAEYELHDNDIHDPRYQSFVRPLTDAVITTHAPDSSGLDVGSGADSVIAHVLTAHGFRMQAYDPFFRRNAALLVQTYDFITCSETVEHFHSPRVEFERLHQMLRPGGSLYISTLLYNESIPFANWHYRRDPTHVFIYRRETFSWLAEHLGFSSLRIGGRLIVLVR
jgi:SAM-dependent methyltransferase